MNSVLNPEAPEFHPLLTNAVQVNKTIRNLNGFPAGPTYGIYETYTDFGVVTCKITKNVIIQSNQIVDAELPEATLKSNENDEHSTDKIIDVNDSLLDRINVNIDTLSGVNQPDEQFMRGNSLGKVAPWNSTPVIAKIKVGDATFIGAKNIPRPQLCFKDPVDNSNSLWVPRISDKPNNIKPLALNILFNSDGEAVGYEHPYAVELDLYRPPSHLVAADAEPPQFPPPVNQTPLTLVDTEAKLDELVDHLRDCDEIAVDLEHHSYRSYQGITCLIQITTLEGGDFIIDTLAIREFVHKLNHSFTDPNKVKIFHGAYYDVKWLQRDFGVYVVGLFDTFQAGKALQLPSLSLKNLLASYCQVETDKKYQMADWRIRPLPEELIEYARTDTHYLIYMWRVMKQQLLDRASGLPTLLLSAFENSRQTSSLTYNKMVMDETSHMDLYIRSKKSFNSQQLSALKVLYKWRDAHARELDEGPSYLIPNHMLLGLAEGLPRELQGVHAICTPMPPFVKVNVLSIHRMILSCRELPPEPTLYEMPSGVRAMVDVPLPPHLIYNVHDLSSLAECSEEQIDLDMAWVFLDKNVAQVGGVRLDTSPDVSAFAVDDSPGKALVSTLNVDAKMFIPPYDRYRAYRAIAQVDEIKDFKDKEAKVVALSRGDELIKAEVLVKLQAQRDAAAAATISSEPAAPAEKVVEEKVADETSEEITPKTESAEQDKSIKKASQRKRKMDKAATVPDDKKKEPQKTDEKVKAFHYKNVNYKKFYSEPEKGHKQPKTKLKKP